MYTTIIWDIIPHKMIMYYIVLIDYVVLILVPSPEHCKQIGMEGKGRHQCKTSSKCPPASTPVHAGTSGKTVTLG